MRDDQITNPAGKYVIQHVRDAEHALDVFHDNVPIQCLDDFEISVPAYLPVQQFDREIIASATRLLAPGNKPASAKVGPYAERHASGTWVKPESSDPDTKAVSALQYALDRWGLLGDERDHPINGCDLVDWFTAEFVPMARTALSPSALNIRWKATIQYRHDNGPTTATHSLQELDELGPIIETGPHWDAIVDIKIVRVNHSVSAKLTVEEAANLV
jgi:hypothetical protein